jgi:6-phosphogluconate dehydrogenase (decarboxylating)
MACRRVGFIGIGNLGEGMAANVLAKGHSLVVMGHRRGEAVERLVVRDASEVTSPAEVAATAGRDSPRRSRLIIPSLRSAGRAPSPPRSVR